MMKKMFWVAVIAVSAILCSHSARKSEASYLNTPLPIKFGDPFILPASNGKYYMYGTSLSNGFEAFVSSDLQSWKPCGQVYRGATDGQWNKDCFWAPEVYERNGKYYLFYSANAKENPTNEGENFKIGVAVSNSPAGPFVDLYNRPLFESPYPVIDADVLFDDANGKCYLYFSRCCYKHAVESDVATWVKQQGIYNEVEESWIYGVEMKPDFSGIIGEPVRLLIPPTRSADFTKEWENRTLLAKEANRRWNEGSYIFREGNTYYMMYSANFYAGGNYAVGYATSQHPLGPFTKAAENPILQSNVNRGGDVTGTGHNMAFRTFQNQWLTAYHGYTRNLPKQRVVFLSRIKLKKGKLIIEN